MAFAEKREGVHKELDSGLCHSLPLIPSDNVESEMGQRRQSLLMIEDRDEDFEAVIIIILNDGGRCSLPHGVHSLA